MKLFRNAYLSSRPIKALQNEFTNTITNQSCKADSAILKFEELAI